MRQIRRLSIAVSDYLQRTDPQTTELWNEKLSSEERALSAWTLLDEQLKKQDYCAAEDLLYEWIDEDEPLFFGLAVHFYSYLNGLSDEELDSHNFPRDEILEGIREVCRIYRFDTEPFEI